MSCYRRLNLEIPENHKIFKEYKNFNFDHVNVKNNLYNKNNTFKQCRLPKDYFSDTVIGSIITDLNLITSVFLIEGYHCYNWHRDAWRNAAFNLTLNDDSDYIVMFAPNYPIDKNSTSLMYEQIEEIKYAPRKFVLFNTQIPHISINRGPESRYLLTISYCSGEPTNSFKNSSIDYTEYEETIKYLDKRGFLE